MDEALCIEEHFIAIGSEEGRNDAIKFKIEEGIKLGETQGYNFGYILGWTQAAFQFWNERLVAGDEFQKTTVSSASSNSRLEKQKKSLKQLEILLNEAPTSNRDKDFDFESFKEKLDKQFKVTMSVMGDGTSLKIPSAIDEQLSF